MADLPILLGSALLIIVAAFVLVRFPRGLIVEVSKQKPPVRLEAALMLVLGGWGLSAFAALGVLAGAGDEAGARLMLALALMALATVAYVDMRFLVIPDLCSLALAVLAVVPPLALPWPQALAGALVCGGLLWAVAFAYKRLAGIDGMGFGDVKLAAALGGLLGVQHGLMTVAMAAVGAAAGGAAVARIRRRPAEDGPALIPYGAALAAAGAGWLIWSRR